MHFTIIARQKFFMIRSPNWSWYMTKHQTTNKNVYFKPSFLIKTSGRSLRGESDVNIKNVNWASFKMQYKKLKLNLRCHKSMARLKILYLPFYFQNFECSSHPHKDLQEHSSDLVFSIDVYVLYLVKSCPFKTSFTSNSLMT